MTNVRDFGAAGDGKTDDSEAIQHAIDEGGGDVHFPPGDYLLKRTVTAELAKCGRTAIHGSGGTAKVIMAGPGPAFRFIATHAKTADPFGFRPEEWQNERMPMVRDIEIEGRHPAANGVEIRGVMQPTLRGVLIREVHTAVHITDRARNVILSGCHIYHNSGIGVHLNNVNLHQAIIADNHISYCGQSGIRIENSEIRNLQITGNDIEYNNAKTHEELDNDAMTGEIYVDVRKGSVREGTICSNTIQATYSPNGANIRFVGRGDGVNHKAGMWSITGNLIGSQAINLHLQSARGVTVVGNHMYSAHKRNILVENSRNIVLSANCFGHNPDYKDKEICTGIQISNSEDCVVSGMLIEDAIAGQNTVSGSPNVDREASFEIHDSRRVTVTGIQITNPSPVGILVKNCSNTMITGSSVFETRDERKVTHSVKWTGVGTGNMLTGCRLQADPTIADSANVTASGNVTG
ncbi:MAG: right-handed parallel beta-helix repeat-containing protein [Planctomycetaceae bacterium]